METQTKVLPLVYQGYSIEPREDNFVTDLGRTRIQILWDDSRNPNGSRALPPIIIRRLWNLFENRKPDPQLFYNEELHKPHGAEAGDLAPMVKRLEEELLARFVYVDGLFVVANENGMVKNLGDAALPVFISPVDAYTSKSVTPKDKRHGMSLEEFKEAGGVIIAHGTIPASQYQLKHNQWIWLYQASPLALEDDRIYANLDPNHSDGVKALGWLLHWPGGGPSYLGAGIGLDDGVSLGGVLRGRKLSSAASY